MTGDEDSEVVINNNSNNSCTQISSNTVTPQKGQKRKDDTGSNGSSLSSEEGSRQVASVQARSAELVSEVSSVSGEPLTSLGHPSKNSVFSENDADIISTTALSNSPSVDSNSEVFISGASTSTSALCGNGDTAIAVVHGDSGATPTGQSQLSSDAQVQDDPDHVVLSDSDLQSANLDQMLQVYQQLQSYIHKLKGENQGLKEAEDKMRLQQNEANRRENILVMRLATKDQEVHDCAAQINELKTAMAPSTSSLKSSLLDPAVNFIIQKMKKELTETKKKLEDTQNDLNAWKFTADSNTGKRLMAKCRMLYQENEDLGKMITSGRLAKLESDLALQKSLTEEMKKAQSEMDDLVQELDEDVEGMQSTIFFLQQQLREKISSNVAANSTSSQSSDRLVTVNVSELCAQCRVAQDKKQVLKHTNCADPKLVKMEVDTSIDEENNRTQDSSNSSDVERTLQNGESDVYSPTRGGGEPADSKLSDKRTSRVNRHPHFSKQSVNLNAESTCLESSKNSNNNARLGLPLQITTQCNNASDGSGSNNNKSKSNAPPTPDDNADNKAASEEETGDGDDAMNSDVVKPPAAKRTKIVSGNANRSAAEVAAGAGQMQNAGEESRTSIGQTQRSRNGAVEHS